MARVWSFGKYKPDAQISITPGFICSPDKKEHVALLGTGVANWEAKKLKGYDWINCNDEWILTGAKLMVDGNSFPWGFEKGEGGDWRPVEIVENGYNAEQLHFILSEKHHLLSPAILPPMLEQEIKGARVRFVEEVFSARSETIPVLQKNNDTSLSSKISQLIEGKHISIEANTTIRGIIELDNYYCAYPEITVSGGKGSCVRINWAETLFDEEKGELKSNRGIIENKYFRGYYDTFITDGGVGRKFDTLWWQAGRYIEITVKTENEPLTIESLKLVETRYPLKMISTFTCNENSLMKIIPISLRTLQMCSHETFLDCPFYEQVMYAGDTRVQVLGTYAWTDESLLPEKAIQMFSLSSENHTGFIIGAYPSNNHQVIPSWCLWWIGMVYDYALWRKNKCFIEKMMPTVRKQLDLFLMNKNEDGLIKTPGGWNLIDWANDINNQAYEDGWSHGEPLDNGAGVSALINLQVVLILTYVHSFEKYIGETELANRAERLSKELMSSIVKNFWVEEKGMFADDLDKRYYSEHAQVLAGVYEI